MMRLRGITCRSNQTIEQHNHSSGIRHENNGLSLNDVLLVGPIIQDPLFTHLLRFCEYKYVLFADIEKMYR